jgi:sulfur carrier protein
VQITLNGEVRELREPVCVRGLLESCGLGARKVAVAINAEVIPRSRFDEVQLRAGDRVEVIHAVGGG